MKQYYLSKVIYYANLERQENTFIQPRELKKNEIALWNKNGMSYSYWKVVSDHPTKDALILERGSVPDYWKAVIHINIREGVV